MNIEAVRTADGACAHTSPPADKYLTLAAAQRDCDRRNGVLRRGSEKAITLVRA